MLNDINVPSIRDTADTSVLQDWKEFYPDAVENNPKDKPAQKGKLCTITCYVDADHTRDMVTRKSVTGLLMLINNTLISWMSQCQKTVEVAAYGSEMVASRIAVETIIFMRCFLYMLGLNLESC